MPIEDDQSAKRFFYQSIAEDFERLDNPYDIARRLSVVFDDLMTGEDFEGKHLLDAGCGYGAFSKAARSKGAQVTSLDIADKLVRKAAISALAAGVVGDAASLSFRNASFDIVLSSEMIEHTTAPGTVTRELVRVLRPGGLLVLTTPNKAWLWLVSLATLLHTRPFRGLENFVSWAQLESYFANERAQIVKHLGFHPWPFQIKLLWRLSKAVDRLLGHRAFGKIMINQAILVQKE